MPERIQLRRAKGWKKPAGAVVVSRPSKWGNPFTVGGRDPRDPLYGRLHTAAEAVERFRTYTLGRLYEDPTWLDPLRGRDLCCWCPIGSPCHADVLLELANDDAFLASLPPSVPPTDGAGGAG